MEILGEIVSGILLLLRVEEEEDRDRSRGVSSDAAAMVDPRLGV